LAFDKCLGLPDETFDHFDFAIAFSHAPPDTNKLVHA
jgi:hypothetical protein